MSVSMQECCQYHGLYPTFLNKIQKLLKLCIFLLVCNRVTFYIQEGHMALDPSSELKIACGSDSVMASGMSVKGDHFVWLPWQNFRLGIFEALAGTEHPVKHQQGKRPCEAPSGKEVSCLFLALVAIFLQPSGTVLAILVKRHKRSISVKFILNRATGLGGDVV